MALSRSIGGPRIDNFDPFLLLDEFKSEDVSPLFKEYYCTKIDQTIFKIRLTITSRASLITPTVASRL